MNGRAEYLVDPVYRPLASRAALFGPSNPRQRGNVSEIFEYLIDKDGDDDALFIGVSLMSKKLPFLAPSRALAGRCLQACSVGVLAVSSAAPAWAQASQAGTTTSEEPTVEVDDAWREGRATTNDWRAVVGVGIRVAPDYEGSDKLKMSAMPSAAISWKDRVTLDIRGVTAYPVKTSNFRLGLSVGYAPGRNEDRNDRLIGLGDIDTAVRTRALMDYRLGLFTLGIDVSKDFGGSDGVEVRSSATVRIPVAPRIALLAGASATWADGRDTSTYYGVTAAQSVASGLPIYDAGAGIRRIDADVGVAWSLSRRLSARARVGIGRFVGDAADSPIIEKATQPFMGLSLARRF